MFNTIKCDLTNAMKEKDKFKLDCIRMLKSSLQMEEINLKHELTDDEILAVIKREVKNVTHLSKNTRNMGKMT